MKKKKKITHLPIDSQNDFLLNTLQIGVTSKKSSEEDVFVEIVRMGCLIGKGWLNNKANEPVTCPECGEERGFFYDVDEPQDGIQIICLSQYCKSSIGHIPTVPIESL